MKEVTFGHPQTSFFETIDEQNAFVLAQIAEVRIRIRHLWWRIQTEASRYILHDRTVFQQSHGNG